MSCRKNGEHKVVALFSVWIAYASSYAVGEVVLTDEKTASWASDIDFQVGLQPA